jgi:hypothetical protein
MIDEYGALGGTKIVKGTEVLGRNLSHCHVILHKSSMTLLGVKPWRQRWEAVN